MFAGGPDFNWSIYDWINKGVFCPDPQVPPSSGGKDRCHKFEEMLGAEYNTSHFGDQAKRYYEHYHDIATRLADRAKSIAEQFDAKRDLGFDSTEYVREAEIEALTFEGFAQHFLQDRWSIGHMWQRWGPPDPADRFPLQDHELLETGMIAGIIHGARPLKQHLPDYAYPGVAPILPDYFPMCQPTGEGVSLYFAKWSDTTEEATCGERNFSSNTSPGVGDQFLASSNTLVDIAQQRDRLRQCSIGGWTDVISRFKPNLSVAPPYARPEAAPASAAGVYSWGALALRMRSDVRGHLGPECWNAWATNESMEGAWRNVVQVEWLPRQAIRIYGRVSSESTGQSVPREAWLRTSLMLDIASFCDPEGTDIARGKFIWGKASRPLNSWRDLWPWFQLYFWDGVDKAERLGDKILAWPAEAVIALFNPTSSSSTQTLCDFDDTFALNCALPGNYYGKKAFRNSFEDVSYFEPRNFEDLDNDRVQGEDGPLKVVGRDKTSIFGFFNRAHVKEWCGSWGIGQLAKLRGNPSKVGACEYLADRFYAGTPPSYGGSRREDRGNFGQGGAPVCAIFGVTSSQDKGESAEALPFYIEAGYVGRPGGRSEYGLPETLRNWCGKIPILSAMSGDSGDIVAHVPALTSQTVSVPLSGFNLGSAGTIHAHNAHRELDNTDRELKVVPPWSDRYVTVELAAEDFPPGIYELDVERAAPTLASSVGRFLLVVGPLPTPTNSPTPSPTSTSTPTPSVTPTCPGICPSATPTTTHTATVTATYTATRSATVTSTATSSPTATPSALSFHFRTNRDCISAACRERASLGLSATEIADALSELPDGTRVEVIGSCDPRGGLDYNLVLGCCRAVSLEAYLQERLPRLDLHACTSGAIAEEVRNWPTVRRAAVRPAPNATCAPCSCDPNACRSAQLPLLKERACLSFVREATEHSRKLRP